MEKAVVINRELSQAELLAVQEMAEQQEGLRVFSIGVWR